MSLAPGTRLGPYEITALLGEGGMGAVFRARDTKLDRDVAIKILPEAFAHDADRLARFTREAKTLASLNHPNIAGIYGLEESSGKTALVMELVEGVDLSALVARGPLPPSDALPIARQIAEALEAAHEQGIVHRDLKPANIKLKGVWGPTPTRLPDGRLEPTLSASDVAGCTVKVLDFGLAKAMDPAGASSASAMNSPTMTSPAMTAMGMILGTAAYMAPEQARGKAVDRRADIWAFGLVLCEMLTGRRVFEGEEISDVLAAVLRQDIDWTALPATTSPRLRRLLERCLDRDVKTRLRDIGEARIEISRIEAGVPDSGVAPATLMPSAPASRWRRALPWAVAGVLAVALVSALMVWAPWRVAPAPAPRRLLASIGVDASLVTERGAAAVLSPDGTTLVFSAQQGSQVRLFIRKLDQLQAAPLAGTDGAVYPFFSPDGQWVAFFAGDKLKKVSVAGGVAITLCDTPGGRGGTWAEDGTIIFSPSGEGEAKLRRVPAAGGKPTEFGTLSPGATTQRWPQMLPGGKAVLFTEHSSLTGFDAANIVVASLAADGSAQAGPAKVVVLSAYYGRYVASGHLLYIQQGTLFAVPFDPVRLETVGQGVPVIEGLSSSVVSGGAQVDVSREGTVAYVPGAVTSTLANPIDWITPDGKTSALRTTRSEWLNPRFSPDGLKMALEISDAKQRDVWVYDLAGDTITQLTFDPGNDGFPVWTPDGKRIAFASDRAKPGGRRNLYWVNADGTGEVTRLTDGPDEHVPFSWHPSGRLLGFTADRAGSGYDLMMLPMEGDAAKGWKAGTPTVFLGTPAQEVGPMFSPDGRFVAYFESSARAAAPYDVFVRPFPGPGGQWRVSDNGGVYPRWSATTRELFWASQGSPRPPQVMFAPFGIAGDAFVPGKPQLWSPSELLWRDTNSFWDLHPDGKRVAARAAFVQTQTTVQDHVVIMSNFFEYLRTIAPVKP